MIVYCLTKGKKKETRSWSKIIELGGLKMGILETRGPFRESSGNLPGPISVFGDKCFLTEVNFC